MVGSMKITKTFSQQSLLQERKTKQKKISENKNLLFLIEIFINDKIEKSNRIDQIFIDSTYYTANSYCDITEFIVDLLFSNKNRIIGFNQNNPIPIYKFIHKHITVPI